MNTLNNIQLKSIVLNTDTNVEGIKLYCIIVSSLKQGNPFVLEIEDDMPLTSSFLNSSLGNIIDEYGYSVLKSHLKLKCNKNQLDRVRKYLFKYNEIYQN